MTLYEIEKTINEILDKDYIVDEETGELLYDISDLEKLKIEKDVKIENTALYIKNCGADITAIANEIKTLTERKRVLENKVERLKNYLSAALNGEKFSTPKVSISYRKSQSLSVLDVNLLPDEYTSISIERKPDKKAIKEAIKNGMLFEGVTLEENNNIQIK